MLAIFSVKNAIISARGIPSRWDVIGQKMDIKNVIGLKTDYSALSLKSPL